MKVIATLRTLHDADFGAIERLAEGWFLGFAARFVFAAVLLVYFVNSALLKFEGGPFSFSFGAYIQILTEQGLAAYDFEPANVPWYLKLVVFAGSWGEFILPLLVVAGLFTRVASVGMIVFIAVQSFVDINFHGVDAGTIGSWFDRDSASLIMDQRALWAFLLVYLAVKGPGFLSLDHLLSRFAPKA
jgi:putative oxidoreductase